MSTQSYVDSVRKSAGFDRKPVGPFRAKLATEVEKRFNDARSEHQHKEREMWLGTLVLRFDAFEIDLLSDLGVLTILDYQMLTKARQAHPNLDSGHEDV